MLNRRTLRIKVMQALFAAKQRFEANYQIARENLVETFSPDLNSMEIQDKGLLKAQQNEALIQLERAWVFQKEIKTEDDAIKEAVESEIINIQNQNKADIKALKVNMVADVEKLKCYYYSFIELLLEFQHLAKNDKKKGHDNFVNNLLIGSFFLNDTVEKSILDCGKKWEGNLEARSWFKNLIIATDEYKKYRAIEKPTFEEDRQWVTFLVKKVLFDSGVIEDYLDERDLFWTENKPIIKSLVLKSVKNTNEGEEFEIQDISYNYEDDMTFFGKLYDYTLSLDDEYKELISKKAVNWDIERLASTDRVILELTIAELLFFPSIPVKVTINEYIELSKLYSTPKSKTFVNGMLDVIASELTEKGEIKKSGRGLLDNK